MSEQMRGEGEMSREDLEEQKYQAFWVAQDKVRETMEEIDHVFDAMGQNRAKAEKVVLEKFASKIDDALRAERESLDAWLQIMRENRATETK